MTIVATVLTYNIIANERVELFKETVDSLQEPGVVVIPVDNHSTDGTADVVRKMRGYCSTDRNTTCGHGTNLAARVAIGTGADLCVLSDDDMAWRPRWADMLRHWWNNAPADVILTGCHIEPEYPWNTIHGTETVGGIPGLIRQSTGAASWSFRKGAWSVIGPVPEKRQGWGDVPTCDRLYELGYRVAQIDLAEHAGHGLSSWGNRTVDLYGWDTTSARRALENA